MSKSNSFGPAVTWKVYVNNQEIGTISNIVPNGGNTFYMDGKAYRITRADYRSYEIQAKLHPHG